MKENQKIAVVCVICPRGCSVTVEPKTGQVEGNGCPRGKVYALAEVRDPQRIVTTTVRTDSASSEPMLPVRSNRAVPRRKLSEIINEANRVFVALPVKMGQVIIPNVCGTGADIIASRSMKD